MIPDPMAKEKKKGRPMPQAAARSASASIVRHFIKCVLFIEMAAVVRSILDISLKALVYAH